MKRNIVILITATLIFIGTAVLTFGGFESWNAFSRLEKQVSDLRSSQNTQIPSKTITVIAPTATSSSNILPLMRELENQNSSSADLVSPDGEWLLGVNVVGQEPLSRGAEYFLQFTNMKGRPNRYVYMDWSERPEDNGYSNLSNIRPIGWNPDGRSVYIGDFPKYNDSLKQPIPYLKDFWGPVGCVTEVRLDATETSYSDRSEVGCVFDFIPSLNRALQFQEATPASTQDGMSNSLPATLTVSTPGKQDAPTIVRSWPVGDISKVTSASLDESRDQIEAAYVLHTNGKNDEAYYFESSSTSVTTPIDFKAYTSLLTKHGITSPYRLVVEKTAMTLPDGLFFVVIGANNKTTVVRFNEFQGKWAFLGMDDGGFL